MKLFLEAIDRLEILQSEAALGAAKSGYNSREAAFARQSQGSALFTVRAALGGLVAKVGDSSQ
jgi:hypothetical protein